MAVPAKISNVHIRYFAAACDKLNIPYRLVLNTHAMYITTKSGKEVFCYKAGTPLNLVSSLLLSRNKRDTIIMLEKSGLPVPPQRRVQTFDDISLFYKTYQQIVIKPLDAMGGKGVTVLPKSDELQEAYNRALKISKKVIVEKYIAGNNYRFLVLDDQVLAVTLRLPPFVRGDGASSVQTLVDDYNLENKAQGIPQVQLNSYTWQIIRNQGFGPNDILPQNTELYLRLTANLSKGGSVRDVTDQCDDSYKQMAIAAAKTVRLRLAGIDMISPNLDKPGAVCAIIETNTDPGMRIHYKDEAGKKRDVAVEIVKAISELT